MNTKNYTQSARYLDTAWGYYSKARQLKGMAEVRQHRADLYSRMGKYNLAYAEQLKFKELYDSTYNETRLRELSDIKTGYEVEKKERELNEKKKIEIAKMNERKRLEVKQLNEKAASDRFINTVIIISILIVLVVIGVFSFILYKRFNITKKQKILIEKQKLLVEEKNKEILDSIRYAKRIQQSLLPSQKYIERKLNKNN